MRNGDRTVADLFHLDAQLIGLGTIVTGRPAIAAFYGGAIDNAGPKPEPLGELLVDGGRVAAEVAIHLNDGVVMHVVDLFVVEAGLIRSLTYFVSDHPPVA